MQNEVANPVAEQAAQLANVAALRAVAAALNTLADALAPVCQPVKAEAEQPTPVVEKEAEQATPVVETPAPVKAKKAAKKVAEQPKPEPEPAPEPVAEQAEPEPAYATDRRALFEDIKARCMRLAHSGEAARQAVRGAIASVGFGRLTEIPLEDKALDALLAKIIEVEAEHA